MIKIRNISKKYFGSRVVLHDISLDINKDEKVFLFGREGSGKSSLLKTIAKIENYESGLIEIDNKNIKDSKISDLDLAFVFQDLALPRIKTVEKVLLRPLRLRKTPIKDARKKIKEIALKFGIEHLLDSPCLFLSNYDRVRVAIARAFVREAKIIIFDNPLALLDSITRREYFPMLYNYISSSNATVIYATDDIEELGYSNNRIAYINNGRLLQYDKVEELRKKPLYLSVAKELGDYNLINCIRNGDNYTMGDKLISLGNIKAEEIIMAIEPDKIVLDKKGDIDADIRYIDSKGYAYITSRISTTLIKCQYKGNADKIRIYLDGALIYDAINEELILD